MAKLKTRQPVSTRSRTPADLVTPAALHVLMTGSPCSSRVPGWVGEALHPPDYAALWKRHGSRLTAEAACHGFVPYMSTGRAPRGTGVADWRAAFLKQYGY